MRTAVQMLRQLDGLIHEERKQDGLCCSNERKSGRHKELLLMNTFDPAMFT